MFGGIGAAAMACEGILTPVAYFQPRCPVLQRHATSTCCASDCVSQSTICIIRPPATSDRIKSLGLAGFVLEEPCDYPVSSRISPQQCLACCRNIHNSNRLRRPGRNDTRTGLLGAGRGTNMQNKERILKQVLCPVRNSLPATEATVLVSEGAARPPLICHGSGFVPPRSYQFVMCRK
jgi:hypothetical protein